MNPHPEDPDSNQSNGPLDANPDGDSDYSAFSDQQLIAQRDRHRRHLDELTTRPASSPAVCQSLVRIEQEIEQITEELTRRPDRAVRRREPSVVDCDLCDRCPGRHVTSERRPWARIFSSQ